MGGAGRRDHGAGLRRDRIISIGAVLIVGNRLSTSQRLKLPVRPERAPNTDSVRWHRLRKPDVAVSIASAEVIRQLLEFIGTRPLMGHDP